MKSRLPVLVLALACCAPNEARVVPSVSFTLTPDQVTLPVGEPAALYVSIVTNDTNQWVLGVADLPQGVTGGFDNPSIINGGKATLTLTADDSALAWSGAITVSASHGSSQFSARAALVVVDGDGAGVGGGTGTGGGAPTGGGTGSTGGGTGTGGGGASVCPGFAAPGEALGACVCAANHTCGPNHCYGGYFCDLATSGCEPPPAGCAGSGGGGGTSTGGGTGSGGGSATGGGSAMGGGGGTTTGVGPGGGTVSLLHFGVTGDTRPPNCDDTANYPTPIITGIASALQQKGVQFVVDEGDHMFVCNSSLATAQAQMALFMQSTAHFHGTWFMAMGNHECWHGPCLLNSTSANYVAFMSALAPVSAKPYYSFNVDTQLGRATFVVIADNAWDSAQQTWLQQVLSEADAHAKYTLVFRHHPEGDTSVTTNPASMAIIRQHKFAMFIAGHTHDYKHMTTATGATSSSGSVGAPLLASGATWNGYAVIDQQADGRLQVTVYDLSGGTVRDSWSVGPN